VHVSISFSYQTTLSLARRAIAVHFHRKLRCTCGVPVVIKREANDRVEHICMRVIPYFLRPLSTIGHELSKPKRGNDVSIL